MQKDAVCCRGLPKPPPAEPPVPGGRFSESDLSPWTSAWSGRMLVMMAVRLRRAAGRAVMCARTPVLCHGGGGRYQSGQDIKCNLVFGSGEYKSRAVWLPPDPPPSRLWCIVQACGQL